MVNFLKNCQRVILGISGGVDSTVAGLILKKQGFDVLGVFMRNWDIADETGHCSVDKDFQDAAKSCSLLGIALHEVNFSKDYWNDVFTDLLEQYENGLTPNPDILCNRHIKFSKFLQYSFEKLGANAVATGHYAQTSYGAFLESTNMLKGVRLLKAKDQFKDQTFFLSQVHQESLQKVMFPLGSLLKSQVKQIAHENNYNHLLNKKESTGICFIGHRNFANFISDYLPDKSGIFIDIDTGKVLGTHRGIHHWTIGQRCRIGGCLDRVYIAKKIKETQDILVASGRKHLILWSKHITTSIPHWIHSPPNILLKGGVLKCDFRFQHTHSLVPCLVMLSNNGYLMITLQRPLFAITPGQYAVLYKDNECLGSAKIISDSPSEYTLNKLVSFKGS